MYEFDCLIEGVLIVGYAITLWKKGKLYEDKRKGGREGGHIQQETP